MSDQQESELEQTVQQHTFSQKLLQGIRGYGVPLLGALGGYAVTHGPGGAGLGMAITSGIIGGIDSDRSSPIDSITRTGYSVTAAVGCATFLVKCAYSCANEL